jgi:hypothetical protein
MQVTQQKNFLSQRSFLCPDDYVSDEKEFSKSLKGIPSLFYLNFILYMYQYQAAHFKYVLEYHLICFDLIKRYNLRCCIS